MYVGRRLVTMSFDFGIASHRKSGPTLTTFFRPQAAGEPFPLINTDGPIQWIEDVIAYGIRDFTYPLVTDPTVIHYGYVTKATRESLFQRLSIPRWPSGYATAHPVNPFTYRQLELMYQNGTEFERRDSCSGHHNHSFLYGNVEEMDLDDPAAHPLLRHVDILDPNTAWGTESYRFFHH